MKGDLLEEFIGEVMRGPESDPAPRGPRAASCPMTPARSWSASGAVPLCLTRRPYIQRLLVLLAEVPRTLFFGCPFFRACRRAGRESLGLVRKVRSQEVRQLQCLGVKPNPSGFNIADIPLGHANGSPSSRLQRPMH